MEEFEKLKEEEKYKKFEEEEKARREKKKVQEEKEKNKKIIKIVVPVLAVVLLAKPVCNIVKSVTESLKTTADLKSKEVVDSVGFEIIENGTTALGTAVTNAIYLDSTYREVGYVEYKLDGKYKSVSLDVIAAEGQDNNVFTAYGDGYELDEKIIHLKDSSAYTAILNVENVDELCLKVRNGNIYISDATLYKNNKLKDECLPRTDKTALVDMFRIEDDWYLDLQSYYEDYKGTEHANILKGKKFSKGQDYTWAESYNLEGKYSKITGTIIPNGTHSNQVNIFDEEKNNDGIFEIYADGNLVYSYVVKPEAESENFEADVTGASILELKYRRNDQEVGVNNANFHGDFAVSALLDDVYLEK